MYAIIKDSGRQFKVTAGRTIDIDKKKITPGEEIVFENVIAISGDEGVKFGTPVIEGAKVVAFVEKDIRGKKIVIRKFRRRKNYRRKTGHVQTYTRVRIKEIISA